MPSIPAIMATLREDSAAIVAMKDGLAEFPSYEHAVTIQLKQRQRDALRAELPPFSIIQGGKV